MLARFVGNLPSSLKSLRLTPWYHDRRRRYSLPAPPEHILEGLTDFAYSIDPPLSTFTIHTRIVGDDALMSEAGQEILHYAALIQRSSDPGLLQAALSLTCLKVHINSFHELTYMPSTITRLHVHLQDPLQLDNLTTLITVRLPDLVSLSLTVYSAQAAVLVGTIAPELTFDNEWPRKLRRLHISATLWEIMRFAPVPTSITDLKIAAAAISSECPLSDFTPFSSLLRLTIVQLAPMLLYKLLARLPPSLTFLELPTGPSRPSLTLSDFAKLPKTLLGLTTNVTINSAVENGMARLTSLTLEDLREHLRQHFAPQMPPSAFRLSVIFEPEFTASFRLRNDVREIQGDFFFQPFANYVQLQLPPSLTVYRGERLPFVPISELPAGIIKVEAASHDAVASLPAEIQRKAHSHKLKCNVPKFITDPRVCAPATLQSLTLKDPLLLIDRNVQCFCPSMHLCTQLLTLCLTDFRPRHANGLLSLPPTITSLSVSVFHAFREMEWPDIGLGWLPNLRHLTLLGSLVPLRIFGHKFATLDTFHTHQLYVDGDQFPQLQDNFTSLTTSSLSVHLQSLLLPAHLRSASMLLYVEWSKKILSKLPPSTTFADFQLLVNTNLNDKSNLAKYLPQRLKTLHVFYTDISHHFMKFSSLPRSLTELCLGLAKPPPEPFRFLPRGLKTLSLHLSPPKKFRLSNTVLSELPPALEILRLQGGVALEEGCWQTLPRSLTTLVFSFDDNKLPPVDGSGLPPSLIFLKLFGWASLQTPQSRAELATRLFETLPQLCLVELNGPPLFMCHRVSMLDLDKKQAATAMESENGDTQV